MIKNYGLQFNGIDSTHYIYGASSLPKVILQPDGDWRAFLPVYEAQADIFETYGCTVWGTENAVEILMKKLYGGDFNYAERFLYILAHIVPPGSDPHLIAEIIRKSGLVNQDVLPMTDTLEEFKKPDPLPSPILSKAKEWLDSNDFGHEWVFTNNPSKEVRVALFKECLQYSPLGITVTAWQEENGLYIDTGLPNTHWCVLVALEEKNGEFYPIVFDSYDQSVKTLHPDHHIEICKRYHIGVTNPQTKKGAIMLLIQKLFELLGLMQKAKVSEVPIINRLSTPKETIVNQPTPALVDVAPAQINYLWDTKENARDSVRVICDAEGLDTEQKDTMCATIGAESDFNIHAKNFNYVYKEVDNHQGTPTRRKILASTDYGICQWNDVYHGKEISPDDAENNPEKAVQLMCAYWKRGQRDLWIGYKSGNYKQYL